MHIHYVIDIDLEEVVDLFAKKHNEPHRLSNQKNFVYQAEIGD